MHKWKNISHEVSRAVRMEAGCAREREEREGKVGVEVLV